ncbi:hypothetical protein N656DRAFT_186035 [Canariomyces notabilis]|uniref:Secreted protein n=1 Tax=Canariomyces notabilis TaxID=2074819 RepID=A0AAN6QIL1_9PEZI|nr:hypothetical protein N656DRAFT_186035 [Canariomyces arenarius]
MIFLQYVASLYALDLSHSSSCDVARVNATCLFKLLLGEPTISSLECLNCLHRIVSCILLLGTTTTSVHDSSVQCVLVFVTNRSSTTTQPIYKVM